MSIGSELDSSAGHKWHHIPSRMVVRRWCSRCGCLAEGDQVWAKKWPPTRWDWQFTLPGSPPKIFRDAPAQPSCPGSRLEERWAP